MTRHQDQFSQIKTFIFDIDGVLTDGGVSLLASGERFRTVFIRDTYAIEQALKAGFRVGIISAANADGLRSWLTSMNVKDIFMGGPSDQKMNAYLGYIARDGLNESEILYMGDDLPDYPILNRPAVLSTCPADAVTEVQAVCQYVSPNAGGRGAVRDVIEQVMKAQGKWGL
ncbi:KdsC family phosphatase [Spirosoma radiotolerans]|uniref:3-deoxy-D-manno-octulosonate 8-phosphate phosphatase n=1 Tax=Spirosoma radiotolerans TaxID=1379870 RepID=A0A0E3V9S3_9BACT|nr:3-deoxy-D-manno-octulosonate 8-phosphate phosphatase [Spirosoma radiotolerans]AKD57411.1 3-deoxy-D-manno-octulosonate 8-phosphate phosphatase [Spirosoma radiotolerans]